MSDSASEREEFIRLVAHDLLAPFRHISILVELLKTNNSPFSEKDLEQMGMIQQAAAHGRDLVTALTQYLRQTSDEKKKRADLTELARGAQTALDEQIKKSGGKIKIEKLPTLLVRPRQIQAVFFHLLDNAIRYRGPQPSQIFVSAEKKGGEWIFCVKDNGIGIESLYRERVFRIFQKIEGVEGSGAGIGLAVAKAIIEEHGGKIWLESEKGAGSRFYFSLPTD
jgi:chemotaxis family two-component system sensor kinase Cph1